jgi:hypothetical protein
VSSLRASRVRGGARLWRQLLGQQGMRDDEGPLVAVLYGFGCGVRIGSREGATGSGRLAACCPSAICRSLSPSDRTVQRRVGTIEGRTSSRTRNATLEDMHPDARSLHAVRLRVQVNLIMIQAPSTIVAMVSALPSIFLVSSDSSSDVPNRRSICGRRKWLLPSPAPVVLSSGKAALVYGMKR